MFQDGYELPEELGLPVQEEILRGGGIPRSVVQNPTGGQPEAGKGLAQDAQVAGGAGIDPALKMSNVYAAHGMGRQPGVPTQAEMEAKVRASIPGGDKELPSEIREDQC